MITDLKVKIPIRFKKDLDDRFNPDNAVEFKGGFEIHMDCPLCQTYNLCSNCPFHISTFLGCFEWMTKVLNKGKRVFNTTGDVWWRKKDDKLARNQLLTLRRKAKKLITWVKEK